MNIRHLTALLGLLLTACGASYGATGDDPAPDGTTPTGPDPGSTTTPMGGMTTPATTTPTTTRSLKEWATCDGKTDDSVAVAKAFAAASHNAFLLLVDCTAKLAIGGDVLRSIFVDDGTNVTFSPSGKFILDNMFTPGFVLANATNVTFSDWNVEWDSTMPTTYGPGYYFKNGVRVEVPGGNGSGYFNDFVIGPWLTKNRGIVFDQSAGRVTSTWNGSVNVGALFYLHGDTSNVTITGMHVGVPTSAGGERFAPFIFSFGTNYKSNQTVTAATPVTSQFRESPHDLTFTNITLDGTYMGFQGALHDATFTHIHSIRYGDVMDADGSNSGGIGKWFPPPHLFYLNYDFAGDASLANRNIAISDVKDDGERLGHARDLGGTDTISGHALSLKLGCNSCSVDGYQSARPDGFMDVLTSNGLTVSNVIASFDSKFLNDTLAGWRFPSAPYKNVSFENVTLTDTAALTDKGPMSNVSSATNENLSFKNVTVIMQSWAGGSFVPALTNVGSGSAIAWFTKSNDTELISAISRSVQLTLQSNTTVRVGDAPMFTWKATGATTCTAAGAWSGSLAMSGAKPVAITTAGAHDFVLTCADGADTSTTTFRINALP